MLKVEDLRLRYRTDEGDVAAVRGLSLNVERGQFFTLLGPSGCGKTSTLRCIAGLESPTSGSIEIDSTVVYASASNTLIPPHKRNIGMVFQSYAIWPHMTVFDNGAVPLAHGPWSNSTPGPAGQRRCCQAASSSALLWRAPSLPNRPCCSWMNRSAIS